MIQLPQIPNARSDISGDALLRVLIHRVSISEGDRTLRVPRSVSEGVGAHYSHALPRLLFFKFRNFFSSLRGVNRSSVKEYDA